MVNIFYQIYSISFEFFKRRCIKQDDQMSFQFPCAEDADLSDNVVILSHLCKEETVTVIL